MKYELNKSLVCAHSFAMPAIAHCWFELTSVAQISELTEDPVFSWADAFVLGDGSNSIFIDHIDMVLHVNLKGRAIECQSGHCYLVSAYAGENWDEFVVWTLSKGLFGLENLSLIPGTVGAAPVQNIGAYGVEVCDRLDSIQVYDYTRPEKGVFWVQADECHFSYRHSHFKSDWSHYLIVQVRFWLTDKIAPMIDYTGLRDVMDGVDLVGASDVESSMFIAEQIRSRVIMLRQSKLPNPDVLANAGSFFKNPVIEIAMLAKLRETFPNMPAFPVVQSHFASLVEPHYLEQVQHVKIPAAWLLDRLGYKGYWFGDFGCYERQPLVLVHRQDRQSSLVEKKTVLLEFIARIQDDVFKKCAIALEIEPQLLPPLSKDCRQEI